MTEDGIVGWHQWVWASSRSWWWTGKPGVHSPWGCKESDMTEWLNWTWKRIFGGEGGYINSKSAGYNWGTGGCGAGGAGEEESLSEVHPSVAGLLSKDPYGVLLGAVHDKYSASHTCDLNFPSNYTKKAKLDKWSKFYSYIFTKQTTSWLHVIQYIISIKSLMKYFTGLFSGPVLLKLGILHFQHTSVWTIHISSVTHFSCHVWLVVTILDRAGLTHDLDTFLYVLYF